LLGNGEESYFRTYSPGVYYNNGGGPPYVYLLFNSTEEVFLAIYRCREVFVKLDSVIAQSGSQEILWEFKKNATTLTVSVNQDIEVLNVNFEEDGAECLSTWSPNVVWIGFIPKFNTATKYFKPALERRKLSIPVSPLCFSTKQFSNPNPLRSDGLQARRYRRDSSNPNPPQI